MKDVVIKSRSYRYHENGSISKETNWKRGDRCDYYEYDREGNITLHKECPFHK